MAQKNIKKDEKSNKQDEKNKSLTEAEGSDFYALTKKYSSFI